MSQEDSDEELEPEMRGVLPTEATKVTARTDCVNCGELVPLVSRAQSFAEDEPGVYRVIEWDGAVGHCCEITYTENDDGTIANDAPEPDDRPQIEKDREMILRLRPAPRKFCELCDGDMAESDGDCPAGERFGDPCRVGRIEERDPSRHGYAEGLSEIELRFVNDRIAQLELGVELTPRQRRLAHGIEARNVP